VAPLLLKNIVMLLLHIRLHSAEQLAFTAFGTVQVTFFKFYHSTKYRPQKLSLHISQVVLADNKEKRLLGHGTSSGI